MITFIYHPDILIYFIPHTGDARAQAVWVPIYSISVLLSWIVFWHFQIRNRGTAFINSCCADGMDGMDVWKLKLPFNFAYFYIQKYYRLKVILQVSVEFQILNKLGSRTLKSIIKLKEGVLLNLTNVNNKILSVVECLFFEKSTIFI